MQQANPNENRTSGSCEILHFRFCPYRSRAVILMTSLLRPTRQFRLATSLILLKGTLSTQKIMLPLVAKICLLGDMFRYIFYPTIGKTKVMNCKVGVGQVEN